MDTAAATAPSVIEFGIRNSHMNGQLLWQVFRTRSGYVISFRYDGKKFTRSLKTKNETEALRRKAVIEETLELIGRGVLSIPDGTTTSDFWNFVRSGGRQTKLPTLAETKDHASAWDDYFESIPDGAKEPESLTTEQIHAQHLKKYLGEKKPFDEVATKQSLTHYVRTRQRHKGRYGGKLSPDTIAKELQTFRQLWDFMKSNGHVQGTNPVSEVAVPKPDQKEPFKTYDEITAIIERGGLSDEEIKKLWECLFLRENEIEEVLEISRRYAEQNPLERFTYPMVALHAFTSARRSEMLRSRRDDINGRVLLREKKRKRKKRISFRRIELHPRLHEIMDEWFAQHPGGQHTICTEDGSPLTPTRAHTSLQRVLRGSKWQCIRGYHVFRHSFASNAARRGIHPDIIDEWMGHMTEDMRQRYLHLFPEDTKTAIEAMYAVEVS